MNSAVELCNVALAHLGEAPVVSLDDTTAVANHCDALYAVTRDELLRSHRWNFATKRQTLPRLAQPPPFGWACAYQLPSDCLRVCEVNGSEGGESKTWVIESGQLLSNEIECQAVYVCRVEDVTLFDALFISALSLKLAAALAEAIRGSTGKTGELMQQYERVTAPLARRIDANETRRRKGLLPMHSMAIQSRFGRV